MLRVIPKWKVTVKIPDRQDLVFWVSDDHMSNVWRILCAIDFTNSALVQPDAILIELA